MHSVGVNGYTIFHNQMANAKISLFFSTKTVCFKKQNKMYFLKRKTQQKSETENEAERQKREKKILGETKFESSDNCLWFFKPEIQKSIFIRV